MSNIAEIAIFAAITLVLTTGTINAIVSITPAFAIPGDPCRELAPGYILNHDVGLND